MFMRALWPVLCIIYDNVIHVFVCPLTERGHLVWVMPRNRFSPYCSNISVIGPISQEAETVRILALTDDITRSVCISIPLSSTCVLLPLHAAVSKSRF